MPLEYSLTDSDYPFGIYLRILITYLVYSLTDSDYPFGI
jgi:hypothetical protein